MRIALYARVSTSRQQQTHTIDQQLARLRAYVTTQADWSLAEEHIFCDDGQSGAKLKRPGLDHLRDQAAQAAFDVVTCAWCGGQFYAHPPPHRSWPR
jgi:site-specific DNA recombinase